MHCRRRFRQFPSINLLFYVIHSNLQMIQLALCLRSISAAWLNFKTGCVRHTYSLLVAHSLLVNKFHRRILLSSLRSRFTIDVSNEKTQVAN